MPYINTLIFFCKLMDSEPDYEKFERFIAKGFYIDIGDLKVDKI